MRRRLCFFRLRLTNFVHGAAAALARGAVQITVTVEPFGAMTNRARDLGQRTDQAAPEAHHRRVQQSKRAVADGQELRRHGSGSVEVDDTQPDVVVAAALELAEHDGARRVVELPVPVEVPLLPGERPVGIGGR